MRISIWQQFSSNHSSNFTIVGRFGSEEDAQQSADKLLQWMTEVFSTGGNRGHISPIEEKIAHDYNLEWYENGLKWNGDPRDITKVVQRTHNDVFLVCRLETWDSPIPFVGLMWKIGARKVEFSEGELHYLSAYLTCNAPDEATALAFCTHTETYFKHDLDSGIDWPIWGNDIDDDTLSWGVIHQEGRKIEMQIQFFEMGFGLQPLISYLEENKFTDIQYDFRQDGEWDKAALEAMRRAFKGIYR